MPIVYRLGVVLARIWCKLCGCRLNGREHIPLDQPVLLIANHTSYADPVLLAVAFPGHITFIGKEAFGRKRLTRWLYGNALGAVFLKKDESDLSALRTSIKLLKEGHAVGIFPEGRRNYDRKISEFMPGAAFIALKAGVPVLPVAISNSGDIGRFWKRNLVVNIGQLITPVPASKLTPEHLAEQAAIFRQNVSELYMENERILRIKQIRS